MKDKNKTKDQLIDELVQMRHRIAELEKVEAERKRAEEELRASEGKYKGLIEVMNDGYVVFRGDERDTIAFANRKFAEILGYSLEEVVEQSAAKFFPATEIEHLLQLRTRVRRGNAKLQRYETKLLTKTGEEVPVEVSFKVIAYEGWFASASIVRDITERKRAEEEWRASEAKYKDLIEVMNDGYVVFRGDERATIAFANRKFAEILGYSLEEVVEQSAAKFFPATEIEHLLQLRRRVRRGNTKLQRYETKLLTKTGEEVPIEVSFKLVAYEGWFASASIVRDITERKQAEEERKRHTERVEALHAIAQTVSQTLDLHEMLDSALAKLIEIMGTEKGCIFVLDVAEKQFLLKAHIGVSKEVIGQISTLQFTEEELQKALRWKGPSTPLDQILGETNLNMVAEAIEKEQIQSFTAVPFSSKGELWGVIAVGSCTHREFSRDDMELLEAIGNEIAVGIENARLVEKARELSKTDELTGLHNRRRFYEVLEIEMYRAQRYGNSLSLTMLDLDGFKEYNDSFGHTYGDAVLKSFAQTLKPQLRKTDIAFRYGGDEFTVIMPATDAERASKVVDRIRPKWLQVLKAENIALETPLGFSAGISEFPEDAETADGLVFLADAALYRSKREGGYKSTLAYDLGALSPEAVDRATLDQVYALSATVEARDPQTYGHSKRVAAISEMIGRAIGLSREELANLHAAALLHDIGKVGVTDSILSKPDKPTEDEWEVIRKHSAEGARIVDHVRELTALVPMIWHHHEWYDGTGYPDGLNGEDIPVGARILAIADAYDTMTTPRTYRDVISQEEALEELRRCSGTQFDPELVQAFCQAMNEATGKD